MPAGDTFPSEIWENILERLSEGEPLRQICRSEGYPSFQVFYRVLADDSDLKGRFARAREVGFDAIAEECMEIADDGSNDWMIRERQDGSEDEVLNHEHVQRSKLRIETRLKLLAKWSPKYADKPTGEDDEPPPNFTVNIGVVDASKKPDGEPDSE